MRLSHLSVLQQVPRKRAASSSAVSALSTPAGAVINAANKGRAVPAKAPSSAGHTPMNRLTCGVQSTPMPGFPGFTPPVTALRDNGTPNAKLGLFRSCSRGSHDAAAGDGRSSGAEGSGAGLIRTGSTTPASGTPSATAFSAGTPLSCTPDTAAKAALQGALDVAAGADGAKSGEADNQEPCAQYCDGLYIVYTIGLHLCLPISHLTEAMHRAIDRSSIK